ncbi:MAG: aminotransferase class I/II-fold pyridoxal phosphate-dependent enzyme, partial [Oscillospiraceae bacterium]|nr:aminotransferase class I/II-fold pyridoxal phosphate-dependent enzyme [Oscillospiraceae bacterium]
MIHYVDRVGSHCIKWDMQENSFGENGLLGMWVADMDFQSPESVQKVLRDYVEFGVYGYTAPAEGYFDAFMDWEREHHGYAVKKEWMRYAPGVVPAFNWWVQIATEPGDAVMVLMPVYYPFHYAVKNNGRRLIAGELHCENGLYSVDFDLFEKTIVEEQVKAFILCSPHNPVGRVWKREELARMLEICRRHGVFVISDEIHHDLEFNGSKHIPSATVGEYDDMLVTI